MHSIRRFTQIFRHGCSAQITACSRMLDLPACGKCDDNPMNPLCRSTFIVLLGILLCHVQAFSATAMTGNASVTIAETAPIGTSCGIETAPGFTTWIVPCAPNGFRPTQCWLSIAPSPDGDVYLTGSDHKTNFALYKLSHDDGILRYTGDARSASEAAHNWYSGETAEKCHMRPIIHKGRLYLATADFTDASNGYLQRRGFHWYGCDLPEGMMNDLSASEPNGTGGAHASIVAATLDSERGWIYAISTPTCELFRYDTISRRTEKLGRPPCFPDGFVMPGRYLWMGRQGRVYFTASTCDHVLFFDPVHGFGERPDWKLCMQDWAPALRTGAETANHAWVYAVDVKGHIYRYDRTNDTFGPVGTVECSDARYKSDNALMIRSFNVSTDGHTIYFINEYGQASALWEWSLDTGKTTHLCDLGDLDKRLAGDFRTHAGNDSLGTDGCLYFCSFSDSKTQPTNLLLSRVNLEKLKEWLKSKAQRER